MKPGSDTAKQDLILVVVGLVSLLLFFWLYYDFHPLPAADNSLGETTAQNRASEYARSLGFEYDGEPVTRFSTDSELLDSLQKQTDFKEFYTNEENRKLYPVFYWSTNFKTGSIDQDDGIIINPSSAQNIEFRLSESGEFIALTNEENHLPDPIFRPEVLNYGLMQDSLRLSGFENDSLFSESIEFRFNPNLSQQANNTIFESGRVSYLGPEVAQRMAEYYLDRSGWPAQEFTVTSTERVPIGDTEGARISFVSSMPDIQADIQLDIQILPAGGLVSMQYSHPSVDEGDQLFSTIKSGIRAIVLLIGSFWIIVLLFIRFRLRLIDIKAAILVAVLAGMIFPLVLILQNLYTHLHNFGEIDTPFILMQLITIGFTAAISTLGFFAVTAISDSITRQYWTEKLQTIDVLRIGYFNNIPVGLAIIRGISFGFILALIWCLILIFIPNSYITLDSTFEANNSYLPYLSEILGNFAFYFLMAQVIFLIFSSLLRSRYKSTFGVLLLPSLLFIVLYPFPFEVGTFITEVISAGAIGLSLGIIYYREDFSTTFIAMFVFVTLLSTSGGWLIENSPDAVIFYSFLFLLIIGFIAGGYNIYRGRSVRELPRFVPEYIEELAQEDRIRQELNIARSVQQSFLPVATPAVEGYDIAAICKPAYETGGDYYDFISLKEDRLAITIGDVSGKGIQAAFYMTFAKGVLHALCSENRSTIDILIKTNNLFRKNANRGTFISLIFGILDLKKNKFMFSRAGHNPVLYFNNRKKKLLEYQPEGLAIGMASEDIFRKNISEDSIELHKDDFLILFTDGVVESISKTNNLYGDKRLQNLIKRNYKLSSKLLLDKLEEDLEKFGEKSAQHDDLTMIVIKKK